MDGKLILGFLNYSFLGLIFIFGLIALLIGDQRKKLMFFSLTLLSSGVLSYLFFAGISLILPGIILIFFCLLLFMLIASQEFYGFGKPSVSAGQHMQRGRQGLGIKPSLAINFLLSLIISAGAAAIFFIYTKNFFKDLPLVKSFEAAATQDVINNIGANYIPVILVISLALFSSVFWFISILEKKGVKN